MNDNEPQDPKPQRTAGFVPIIGEVDSATGRVTLTHPTWRPAPKAADEE